MRKIPMALLLALAATACGTVSSLIDDLTDDGTLASALNETPDPAGSCDATRISDGIVTAYAAYQARLAGTDTTSTDRPRRHGPPFELLGLVYDADGSGTLEAAELQAISSDFAAGCTAMQAKLVAQYDTDGDGTLSDEEKAAAHDAIEAAHPHDGHHGGPGGPPPDGDQDGSRPPPPADGSRPPPPADGSRPTPPADGSRPPCPDPVAQLTAEFDTNADGTLDADELATLRSTVRARIVAGERPFAPPPPPPADDTADAGP